MIVTHSLVHTHCTHCHIIEPWFYNFYWNHVHGICNKDGVLNVFVNLNISGIHSYANSTKSIFLWMVWWNSFGFFIFYFYIYIYIYIFFFFLIWRRDVIAVSSFNLQIACLNCSANCHWARLEINWCNWARLKRDLEKLSKALWVPTLDRAQAQLFERILGLQRIVLIVGGLGFVGLFTS